MRRTAIDASRKPQVIKEVSVGAGVTDFPDSVHIAFKRNDLPDAESLLDLGYVKKTHPFKGQSTPIAIRPPRKAIRYYVLHGISEQSQNHRSEKSSEKTV